MAPLHDWFRFVVVIGGGCYLRSAFINAATLPQSPRKIRSWLFMLVRLTGQAAMGFDCRKGS